MKLKVGLVGLMQPNFRGDKELEYKKCVAGLKELSEKLGFDLYHYGKLISTVEEAKRAKEELEQIGVDLFMVLNVSFASGYLIQTLGQTNAFLALWSIPEQTNSGPLPQNSFCAMNLNASLLKSVAPTKRFKWFYGHPEDEIFQRRFFITVQALKILKNLRGKKILEIGGWAPGFDNLSYDAKKIEEVLGVKVEKVPFETLKQYMHEQKDVEQVATELTKRHVDIDDLSMKVVEPSAALIRAVRQIRSEQNAEAIALLCWPRFRTELCMVPCAAMGFLNDEGIVVACEGDVVGAVSMLVLKLMSDHPSALFDIASVDLSDDSLLFWHCGVGMRAYSSRLYMRKHFNPGPYDPERGWLEMGAVSEMVVERMPATVLRLTDNSTKALVFEGEFLGDVKPSFDGSRGWFAHLKDPLGRNLRVLDLVNTIMCHKIEHHFAIVRGHWAEQLSEMFQWLGIELIQTVPYSDNRVC